ncbi:MAG TPA: hypothetical protein PL037_05445, partial [Elusimicrobiales bacterium]|nr:hypothetical protein [Elusimicrobiales bacterium]
MADSIDEKRDDDNEGSSGNGSGAAKKRTSFFGRSDGETPVIGKFGSSFRKGSSSFSFGRSTGAFSRAAGSLKDRLKNLSKKDLAFVAMGLSVLVAAPVAEHMISAPPAGTGELTPGFGDRRRGVDGSVYEPGINALSQGSPDGSGEVITPLSSRDPMSLIMGSSPAQPPSPPPSAPPSGAMNTMRDAVRNSMAQASKSAGAPTVIPKMQTAFRGISSVLSGDNTQTKGTGGLGGAQVLASAKNASGKAASRSMVGPIGGADYKGVATSPNSANKGAFENLRGAAERASSNFSGGSGMGSLEKAANDSVFASPDDGGVSGGSGAQFSLPPGSSIKGQIQIGGESLAQMAARMRMQKALEWEAYKKYEIPKKVIDALIGYVTGALKDEGGKDEGTSEADIMGQGKGLFCHRKEGGTIPFEYCNAKKIDCGGCVCGVNKNPNGSMCNGKGGDPAAAGAADPLGGKGGDPAASGAPTAGGGGSGGPLPSMSPES